MPSATLQAKIAAFEPHVHPSSPTMVILSSSCSRDDSGNLLETPISPTTAKALPPAVQFTPVNKRKQPSPKLSPSPSPPNLGRKTSLIDLKDWVVEDEFSETANGLRHPRQHHGDVLNSSKKVATTPIIKLESPPQVKPKPKHLISKPVVNVVDAPRLRSIASSSLQSPSYFYPPRRNDSLTVDASRTHESGLRPKNPPGHVQVSSISSFHSVSLSSDTDISTPSNTSTFTNEPDHERDYSVKSYGSDSVSLSESYEEVSSLMAASPVAERLINLDWERASAQRKTQPPGLPLRQSSPSMQSDDSKLPRPVPPEAPRSTPASPRTPPSFSPSSSSSTLAHSSNPTGSRRPPPPSRHSDRTSIRSNATPDSSRLVNYLTYQPHHTRPILAHQTSTVLQSAIIQKTRRPTPIPPKARKRYEQVFNANIVQFRKAEKQRKDKPGLLSPSDARKSRKAAGWRGLSIDLTTAAAVAHPVLNNANQSMDDGDALINKIVNDDDALEGRIVRCIWARSGLDTTQLRRIWDECDSERRGVLSRDSFVRGMWRIDEELRRAHAEPLKFSRQNICARHKETPPPPHRTRVILT